MLCWPRIREKQGSGFFLEREGQNKRKKNAEESRKKILKVFMSMALPFFSIFLRP